MSCPAPAGAEIEPGAPAVGAAEPGCPGWPSPSMLASFPMTAGCETEGCDDIYCEFCVVIIKTQRTQRSSSSAIIAYNPASCTEHARAVVGRPIEHAHRRERQGEGVEYARVSQISVSPVLFRVE